MRVIPPELANPETDPSNAQIIRIMSPAATPDGSVTVEEVVLLVSLVIALPSTTGIVKVGHSRIVLLN